jgi:hypothetical protein
VKGSATATRSGSVNRILKSFDKQSSIRGSGLALSIDMSHERTGSAGGVVEHVSDRPPSTLAVPCFSMCDYSEPALDDVIAASFPASDPPSWTTGTATVAAASSLP